MKRLAALRATQRVLLPSVRSAGIDAAEDEAAQIGSRLRELVEGLQLEHPSGESEALAKDLHTRSALQQLDGSLSRLASQLLRLLDHVTLPQLRATLPTVAKDHPEEVAALIDLVLEGGFLRPQRLSLFDYVITLLSCTETDGRREVVREPSEVTARLSMLANAIESDKHTIQIESGFRDAEAEIERASDVAAVIADMRSFKQEHVAKLLHPQILASMVSYNVAVWNRLAAHLESNRAMDRLLLASLDSEKHDSDETAPDPTRAALEALESSRSRSSLLLGSAGLTAISDALGARLRGDDPGQGAAAAIAAGADLRQVKDWEADAFQKPSKQQNEPDEHDASNEPNTSSEAGASEEQDAASEQAEWNDSEARSLRTAVAVGLTRRQLPDMAAAVQKLGIEPELLEGRWIDEIDSELSRTARALMAEAGHERACQLLDTKTRFLYSSVTKQRRDPPPPKRRTAFFVSPSVSSPRESRVALVAALLFLFVATGALVNAIRPSSGSIDLFSTQELGLVSPYLESGYRNGQGAGPLFIGTVTDEWAMLDPKQRAQEGRDIGNALKLKGVTGVLLFDRQHKVQLRVRGGEVVFD